MMRIILTIMIRIMMMLILMQMLMIVGLDTLCDNLGRQNYIFSLDVIKFQTKE